MTAILTEDIRSNCKGLELYGLKGSKVTVIAVREKVYIVELKGNRFPIHESKIKVE